MKGQSLAFLLEPAAPLMCLELMNVWETESQRRWGIFLRLHRARVRPCQAQQLVLFVFNMFWVLRRQKGSTLKAQSYATQHPGIASSKGFWEMS